MDSGSPGHAWCPPNVHGHSHHPESRRSPSRLSCFIENARRRRDGGSSFSICLSPRCCHRVAPAPAGGPEPVAAPLGPAVPSAHVRPGVATPSARLPWPRDNGSRQLVSGRPREPRGQSHETGATRLEPTRLEPTRPEPTRPEPTQSEPRDRNHMAGAHAAGATRPEPRATFPLERGQLRRKGEGGSVSTHTSQTPMGLSVHRDGSCPRGPLDSGRESCVRSCRRR